MTDLKHNQIFADMEIVSHLETEHWFVVSKGSLQKNKKCTPNSHHQILYYFKYFSRVFKMGYCLFVCSISKILLKCCEKVTKKLRKILKLTGLTKLHL